MAILKYKHFNPGDVLSWIRASRDGMVECAKYRFKYYYTGTGESMSIVEGIDHPGEFTQPSRYFILSKDVGPRVSKVLTMNWEEQEWKVMNIKCAMCGKPCRPDPEDEYDLCKKCDGTAKPRRKKFKTQLTINEDHLIFK